MKTTIILADNGNEVIAALMDRFHEADPALVAMLATVDVRSRTIDNPAYNPADLIESVSANFEDRTLILTWAEGDRVGKTDTIDVMQFFGAHITAALFAPGSDVFSRVQVYRGGRQIGWFPSPPQSPFMMPAASIATILRARDPKEPDYEPAKPASEVPNRFPGDDVKPEGAPNLAVEMTDLTVTTETKAGDAA